MIKLNDRTHAILSGLIEYERLQKLPDEYSDCVSDTVLGRRNV